MNLRELRFACVNGSAHPLNSQSVNVMPGDKISAVYKIQDNVNELEKEYSENSLKKLAERYYQEIEEMNENILEELDQKKLCGFTWQQEEKKKKKKKRNGMKLNEIEHNETKRNNIKQNKTIDIITSNLKNQKRNEEQSSKD
ncbi:conserved Plasmodium protein, unknown function [Plasmodium malariae]|uniref:Uncharacterized protein n=1 Tax=Plasmodium malariae TaxID=5858 RepID=A0A1A8WES2_PLAMA|nr:conserved Plasmodium protein, unknown function [Plasmodium malariae]